MEKLKSFVAVDFEHLTPNHETVCAVGLVVVEDGFVAGKFFSLIKPYSDAREHLNTHIHGITEDMCENAPSFDKVLPIIQTFVGNKKMVAHHASTEINVFKKACARAGLVSPYDESRFIDTYAVTNKSLEDCCKEFGITLTNHHDPLDDALACARLYLRLQDEGIAVPKVSSPVKRRGEKRDPSLNVPPNLDAVVHKDNPFFDKHFCVSGFPAAERDSIISFVIKELGGWNDNSILKNTSILIGHSTGCGPAKLEKARSQGCIIYDENAFITNVVEKYRVEFPPSNECEEEDTKPHKDTIQYKISTTNEDEVKLKSWKDRPILPTFKWEWLNKLCIILLNIILYALALAVVVGSGFLTKWLCDMAK